MTSARFPNAPPSPFADYCERARLSEGRSVEAVHRLVAEEIAARCPDRIVLADVGCGRGDLYSFVSNRCGRYLGVDAIRYAGFPDEATFVAADLNDAADLELPGGPADVVVALETIEHLENPRAFMRLLYRLARPGGWVMVTTPNQRSLLSLATLLVRGHFSQFQDVHYPAHLTALLDADLRRMAAEVGLRDAGIRYTGAGRMVFSARHYPKVLSRLFPRALSDNVLLVGRRPS